MNFGATASPYLSKATFPVTPVSLLLCKSLTTFERMSSGNVVFPFSSFASEASTRLAASYAYGPKSDGGASYRAARYAARNFFAPGCSRSGTPTLLA